MIPTQIMQKQNWFNVTLTQAMCQKISQPDSGYVFFWLVVDVIPS